VTITGHATISLVVIPVSTASVLLCAGADPEPTPEPLAIVTGDPVGPLQR
jgi:hypothetical protein